MSAPEIKQDFSSRPFLWQPLAFIGCMLVELGPAALLGFKLFRRDIKLEVRGTLLGLLWLIVPPLVYTGLFVILQQAEVIRADTGSVPYPLFVLAGTIFWQVFADSLGGPMREIQKNQAFIQTVNFAREALLFSGLFHVMLGFTVRLVLFAGLLLYYGLPLQPALHWLLLSVFMLAACGMVLAIIFLPLQQLSRDFQKAFLFVPLVLIYFVPVLYNQPDSGILMQLMQYNPLTPLIENCRSSLFSGIVIDTTSTVLSAAIIFAALLPTLVFYRISSLRVLEKTG